MSKIQTGAQSKNTKRLPPWFKVRLTTGERFVHVRDVIRDRDLHTVCQSAACPNRNECWNGGTATFMVLGNVCTRGCGFCNVPKGMPAGLDRDEPERVADAVFALKLRYAVVTSVTRDDLPDGGASIFSDTIRAIRKKSPGCRVEVLVPDFQGSEKALMTVLAPSPDVLNHNIETVPSLYPLVRPKADYSRSLELLKKAKTQGAVTKSGLMLGLGEGIGEVWEVMGALRSAGCDILTLGQYLRPRKDLLPVVKFYQPEEFETLRQNALLMGFRQAIAGPLIRSSYHADQCAV